MPTTMKLEDGSEAEVFTQEELDAKQEEAKLAAIEEYKANNPDKSEELEKLQEELKGYKDKDMNFGNLRKQKDEAEKKVEEILKGVDDKISSVKKEVLEGVMQEHKNDTLKLLSGGDAELEKKIEYHYKRLGDVASTKEEITNKLKDAYILAAKQQAPDAVSMNVYGSGGVGRIKINNNPSSFTPDEKALGAKFGLKDEDYKTK